MKPTQLVLAQEPALDVLEFQRILVDSGLGKRRPVDDLARLERMLRGSDLVVTARREGVLLGVARAITDHAYCCYLPILPWRSPRSVWASAAPCCSRRGRILARR